MRNLYVGFVCEICIWDLYVKFVCEICMCARDFGWSLGWSPFLRPERAPTRDHCWSFPICDHRVTMVGHPQNSIANLTWRASRPLSEFPPPETETRIGRASRERGVKKRRGAGSMVKLSFISQFDFDI